MLCFGRSKLQTLGPFSTLSFFELAVPTMVVSRVPQQSRAMDNLQVMAPELDPVLNVIWKQVGDVGIII
jgi:hypothetical protein